jgi:hypothetical protein
LPFFLTDDSNVLQHLTLTDMEYIRKNIYNARRAKLPPLPKNLKDVQEALDSMSVKTIYEEEFLILNDRNNEIVIFSCFANLKFLCSVDTIYVDGTFDYYPKYFYQLFTVHGYKNGQYVPLVFALLPSKKTATYTTFLSVLINECLKFDFVLKPKKVVADFEKAIHLAIRTVFPECEIEGCLFHLKQAWYRKILELGLSGEYKNSVSPIGKWLKYLFGLPYVAPEDVGEVFCFELMSMKPKNFAVRTFYLYRREF